jgi:hypothetical protein
MRYAYRTLAGKTEGQKALEGFGVGCRIMSN